MGIYITITYAIMVYIGTAPNCSPLFLYCTKQGFELSQTNSKWHIAMLRMSIIRHIRAVLGLRPVSSLRSDSRNLPTLRAGPLLNLSHFVQTVSFVWIILKPLFWQYYESFAMFGSAPIYPIMAVIIKHTRKYYDYK